MVGEGQRIAEPAKGEREGKRGQSATAGFNWVRDSRRGRMVRILENLLKVAKREARKPGPSPPVRLKWVNTVCYVTQTINSLLRDTDYDELHAEVTRLQEKVNKLTQERYQRAQTDTGTGQFEAGKPERDADPPEPR